MKRINFYLTVVLFITMNLTAFTQEQKKDTCLYQPPKISCELATQNATAIYNYPLALKSILEKKEIIDNKDRELQNVRNSFQQERVVFDIDIGKQTEKATTQERRKKNWRLVSGASFLSLLATILIKR